jgi:hypothetical protein
LRSPLPACCQASLTLLTALHGEILAIGTHAQVTNDAARTDKQPPAHTQPTTKAGWLRVPVADGCNATNLKRGVANVRTRDCGRGGDVVCVHLTCPDAHIPQHRTAARAPYAASGENRGQPEGSSQLTLPLSEAKWQLDGRSAAGVTALCCACGRAGTTDACRRANEAVWTRSVSDEVWLPDPRVIIRQPERLECTEDVRLPATFDACARVAKGPPGMTSANQRWRPGARRQSALADWPRMSVRHSRTRPMTFVNGNREWVARSSLLSAKWVRERSANKFPVEQRELTLSFERARIAKKFRIVHDSRIHLATCVEVSMVAGIAKHKKMPGSSGIKIRQIKFRAKLFASVRCRCQDIRKYSQLNQPPENLPKNPC